jgi:uncharacterized protein YlxW (UPF0749 family)
MIDLSEHRAYLCEQYDPDDPDEPSELELVYRKLADEQAENMTLQAEVVQFKKEITRLNELIHVMAWREKAKDNEIQQSRELLHRIANINP